MERTSSAKLDEMLNLQKSTYSRTDLGYELSNSSYIASSNKTVFVSLDNNENLKKNETKTEIASENNLDKSKSILGAPPKIEKKETRNPRAIRLKIRSLNQRSHISVITVEVHDTLVQIAISG